MSLLYFSLATAGLTQILVYGKVLDFIRPSTGWLGQLFSCTMCTGFWSGVLLWALNDYTKLFSFDHSFVTAFLLGCFGSSVSYAFDVIFDDNGIKLDHNY